VLRVEGLLLFLKHRALESALSRHGWCSDYGNAGHYTQVASRFKAIRAENLGETRQESLPFSSIKSGGMSGLPVCIADKAVGFRKAASSIRCERTQA